MFLTYVNVYTLQSTLSGSELPLERKEGVEMDNI